MTWLARGTLIPSDLTLSWPGGSREYWYMHFNQIPCHLSGCIISCCKTGLLAFTGVSADYSTADLYLFHGVFPLVVDICLGIEKLLLQ